MVGLRDCIIAVGGITSTAVGGYTSKRDDALCATVQIGYLQLSGECSVLLYVKYWYVVVQGHTFAGGPVYCNKLEVFIEHIPRAECLQDTVQLQST